ncbi:MAG: ABC transporter substrate-binding protein [Chloroflexota bacterium]
MSKRLILLLVMVVILSAVALGTVLLRQEATPAEQAKFSLRYVNFKVYDPVYVALDKGFFDKYNLKVEILGDSLGGPTAIQVVAAGQAEAGLSSLPALINANAASLPVIGVSDLQSAIGDQPLEEFFVRADSPIQSVADLKGKRVAVNLWKSSFHYTVIMALEKAGLSEKDVEFMLIPFESQELALQGQQVDLIGLMQPYTAHAKAVYGPQFRRLFTAIDVFGNKQFTTHFVNRTWAQQTPQAASAFVSAIAEATGWIEANPEAAKPIIAKYTGLDTTYIPAYHFQPYAQVVQSDVQFWLDYMLRRKDITTQLKPEDIATNRFNHFLKGQ